MSKWHGPTLRKALVVSQLSTGTPEGTRTPNLLIRSQTLYPIELRAHSVVRTVVRTGG